VFTTGKNSAIPDGIVIFLTSVPKTPARYHTDPD